MRQIVKNAKLVNGEIIDIIIKDEEIVSLTKSFQGEAEILFDAAGMYVSPGWIDLHTHAFPKYEPYCALPDDIGYKTGVTTVVDAGSSGADTIDELHSVAKQAKTRILSLLNISRIGLKQQNELSDMTSISFEAIEKAIAKYPDFIVGLKARMSGSVVCSSGIKPLQLAKQFGKKLNLPIMVHVGSSPPELKEILQYLEKDDILTHCFHEKDGNHIFRDDWTIEPALLQAIKRGVYLDIGHGTSSFSFRIAKKAKAAGVHFDSIGTDIYKGNQQFGPVYDMATTLTKFLALGYTLEEVIRAVTETPAGILKKPELGKLEKGTPAELTFFTVEKEEKILKDSLGNALTTNVVICEQAVLLGGELIELEKSRQC